MMRIYQGAGGQPGGPGFPGGDVPQDGGPTTGGGGVDDLD